ncbi:tetratricopeptide repeat protein [Chitinophagaceae bacterium LB-8]|uniref:Tetratricopeptide repeat protein n=1 Tax=Paraflavisolibacter caeni TaxID=2982496 RepID=A0A9X3B772_9BACT|nr:tetratricopeptide repeat protein [Paraflavisolibacter caeni]MCU7548181.1 tetratricopeptide repeat protein [Paraflavisolibacter caeni]
MVRLADFCLVRLWMLLPVYLLMVSSPARGQIDSTLFNTIKKCDPTALQQCMKSTVGMNVSGRNETNALMWAAYYCDLPLVRLLVQQGAKACDSAGINVDDHYYGSMQGIAAGRGKLELLQFLADTLRLPLDEKEYNPKSLKNDGWTPLMWAVDAGHLDVVSYLLEKGARVNIDDAEGVTPLIKAAEKEQWLIFDWLLKAGGREKLGKQADSFMVAAAKVSQQGATKGDPNKQIMLRQFIVALTKACYGEEHPVYARNLNSLGNLYFQMGKYETALLPYQQALTIRKKILGEGHPEYATTLNDLADVYMRLGQYETSLLLYEQALAIKKKVLGEEHPEYATSLNSLAYLYKEMGQYEKALPLYEQALSITIKVQGEDHPNTANVLNNLAFLYREMAHYEKALPLHQQALAIRKKSLGEEHPDYATSLNDLAYLYLNMGQYEKALPLYEQALAIRKKILGEEHPDYATTLNFLAILHREMGHYETALPLYEQALAIRKKVLGEDHPYYASVLNNLAYLYRDLGQYEKAVSLHLEALAIRKKVLGEEHPYYLRNLNGLGFLYSILNRQDKAYPLLLEASATELKYIRQAYTALSENEKMSFLSRESDQFHYLPSVLLGQKNHQATLVKQVYENELALKGMVLEDQKGVLNSIRRSGDSIALQLYKEWLANKAFLGKQLLRPLKQRVSYLDSLEEATNALEQQLSRTTAAFRQQLQNQKIDVEDIAQKLQKGEAAVEFTSFRVYNIRNSFRVYNNRTWTDSVMYAALVLLPGDTTVHFLPLCEEKQLQRLLYASSNTTFQTVDQLYGRRKTGKGNMADSLYQLVWKPLEQYLQGVKTVYYAPAGLLHRLSFQALPIDASNLLIDKYQLRQRLSTRSIALPTQPNSKSLTASLWGNITYSAPSNSVQNSLAIHKTNTRGLYEVNTAISDFNLYTWDTKEARGGTSGWQPLPYTKAELDSLKTVLTKAGMEVNTLSGSEATEETFKHFSGNSPGVLHLATHGFFLPVREQKTNEADLRQGSAFTLQQNPLFRSGLVLAGANDAWAGKPVPAGKEDGILTAYELTQMDLSSTDLVVLSACETALGDLKGNEGVIGLQRALKMAGVKQMIVSLWQVPDKVTMQLMILFYHYWLTGQSPQDALRSAQLQLKAKYPHPYFWAAFVLVE